jgi:dihydrofolate reductase
MIVAASKNNVIGRDGDMPWRLSADLKHFKALTFGHTIIMGRKTWESIGRLLPGRTTVIVTRQTDFIVDGAIVVNSFEDALSATDDEQPFVVGGAEIYRIALPMVNKLYLTRVHAEIDGDTWLPEIDFKQWETVSESAHQADAKNSHDCSFIEYRLKQPDK